MSKRPKNSTILDVSANNRPPFTDVEIGGMLSIALESKRPRLIVAVSPRN